MARVALGCLVEGKAKDIRTLHVTDATILADYFVIAGATNGRQARALAETVQRELKRRGTRPIGIEGMEDGWWVLIDLGSVVVHVMQNEARAFYDLDSYWGESPEVALEPILPEEAA